MTEAEWLVSRDPMVMLSFIERRLSERQKRLFAAACCRRVWHLLPDLRSRHAIEMAEAYADGDVRAEDLWNACEDANAADDEVSERFSYAPYAATDVAADFMRLHGIALNCAIAAGHHFCWEQQYDQQAYEVALDADDDHPYNQDLEEAAQTESAAQANLLRDVVGNPFRHVRFAPWRVEPLRTLARSIYEEQAFDQLPRLADTLVAAGCDDVAVLSHLRNGHPHVRGCWALDALLEPTQQEWEADESLWSRIERLWVWGKVSPRKLTLFGVACVRRSGRDLPHIAHDALAVAERYADGQASYQERKQAEAQLNAWLTTGRGSPSGHVVSVVATILGSTPVFAGTIPLQLGRPEELLREVVGEPFRPVNLSPTWLTPDVRNLAQAAYDAHDFAALPVLGDALEETGCSELRLLAHLRDGRGHVRGCWALDAVLGRE